MLHTAHPVQKHLALLQCFTVCTKAAHEKPHNTVEAPRGHHTHLCNLSLRASFGCQNLSALLTIKIRPKHITNFNTLMIRMSYFNFWKTFPYSTPDKNPIKLIQWNHAIVRKHRIYFLKKYRECAMVLKVTEEQKLCSQIIKSETNDLCSNCIGDHYKPIATGTVHFP